MSVNSWVKNIIIVFMFPFLHACGGGGTDGDNGDQESTFYPPDILIDFEYEVSVGKTSHISAAESYSFHQGELAFEWKVLSKPTESKINFSHISNQVEWEFLPDIIGEYSFKLDVTDLKTGLLSTRNITIEAINVPPIVIGNQKQTNIQTNQKLQIDFSESTDPDGHTINFVWEFLEAPLDSKVSSSGVTAESLLSFYPSVPGNYKLQVYGTDGYSNSEKISFEFNVDPRFYNLYPITFTPEQSLFIKSTNSLLLIEDKVPLLYFFNVTNRELTSINLPNAPLKMAISADETTLAITTKSSLLMVDIETKGVVSETKTEVYGGYPVFYNSNNEDVVVFAGRRLFNAYRYPLRYIKSRVLLPKHLTQYSNGEWGLDFKELVTGGAIAKLNPKTNDIYYSVPSLSSGRPFTRLRISNEEVLSSYYPTIHQDSVGTDFWIDTNGNILTSGGILLNSFIGETTSDAHDEDPFLRRLPKGDYQDTYLAGASLSPENNELLVTPREAWGRQGQDMSRVYLYDYQTFDLLESYPLPKVQDFDGENHALKAHDVYHSNFEQSHIVLSSYTNSELGSKERYFIAVYGDGGYVDNNFKQYDVAIGSDATPTVGVPVNIQFKLLSSHGKLDASINIEIIDYPTSAIYQVYRQSGQSFSFKTNTQGIYTYKYYPTADSSMPKYGQFLVSSPYKHEVNLLGKEIVDVTNNTNLAYSFAINSAGKIFKIDRNTLAVESFDLLGKGYKVELSPDGKTLIASTEVGLYVINAETFKVIHSVPTIFGATDITFRKNSEFFLSPDFDVPMGVPNELLRFNLELVLIDSDPLVGFRNHCLYLSPSDDLFCKERRIDIEESQLGNYYSTHYGENSSGNFWLSHDDELMVKSRGAVQKFLEQPTFLGLDNKELIDDMVYQTLVGAKSERIAYWAWGNADNVGYRIKGGNWDNYEHPVSSKIDVIDNEYFNVVDSINFETAAFMEGDELMYAKFVMPGNQAEFINSIVCSETTDNCYFVKSNLVE